MSDDRISEFGAFRQRMNERILSQDNQVVRRFFALDTQTYKDGALSAKTKEYGWVLVSSLLGIGVAMTAISYHVAEWPPMRG